MAKRYVEVVRTWVATVKYHGDAAGYRTITTSIHGPNPTAAENLYKAEHPDVAAIIIRHESYR